MSFRDGRRQGGMIPRLIHQMFINPTDGGAAGLEDVVLRQCAEWKRHHPDYEYRLWSLSDFLSLCTTLDRLDVANAVQICRFPAMQADIARLLIMRSYGGFWADLKLYPLQPFLDILREDSLVLAEHFKNPGWHPGLPCSAFLAAEPGHAFFDTALSQALAKVSARHPRTFEVAGPAALEAALKLHLSRNPGGVRMLPEKHTWGKIFNVGAGSYNGPSDEFHWSRREQREMPYRDPLAEVNAATGGHQEPQTLDQAPAQAHQVEPNATLLAWAMEQIGPWLASPTDRNQFWDQMHRLHAEVEELSLLRVANGDVKVIPKPPGASTAYPPERVNAYRMWIEGTVRALFPSLETTIALYPIDGAMTDPPIPVFSFQKAAGNRTLLLPDIEMLARHDESSHDDIPYSEKKNHAIFVGSTTGGLITPESVSLGRIPRIRSAQFFHDSIDVTFRLPNIVQCDSDETVQLLRSFGFGDGKTTDWNQQFRNKFIISMDGNGASCSRVFMTLSSNSILMKYNSNNILYYFSGMIPWKHYIPIERDENVLYFVDHEKRFPGSFHYIVSNAREFCSKFLSRESAMHYTMNLLRLYNQILVP